MGRGRLNKGSSNSSSDEATAPPPIGVEKKLWHLVSKLVVSSSNDSNGDSLTVTALLCSMHREYQRKDAALLQAQVQLCLNELATTTTQSNSNINTTLTRKRKSVEKQQQQYSNSTNDVLAHEGHSLNASLRQKYRQVSASRQASFNNDNKCEEVESNDNNGDKQELLVHEDEAMDIINEGGCDIVEKEGDTKSGGLDNVSPPVATKVDAVPLDTPKRTSDKVMTSSQKRKLKRRTSSSAMNNNSSFGDSNMPSFLTPVPRPTERLSDLGGLDDTIQQIKQLVAYPILRPELYRHLGVEPPRGVLLCGPPGTGKTHLAHAVAGELCSDDHDCNRNAVSFYKVSAPELVAGVSGESEARIRDLFATASKTAPSIIYLDELDAIAPKRQQNERGMEKRMVAQLLSSLDSVAPKYNANNQAAVIVLASTNRPDALDPALRRAGRFDKEIFLGVPDEKARKRIIMAMTKDLRLAPTSPETGNSNHNDDSHCAVDFDVLARKTPGFVGADIKSLAKEAAVLAINRIFTNVLHEQPKREEDTEVVNGGDTNPEQLIPQLGSGPLSAEQMEPLYVTMNDFLTAIPLVQPSSKREGFATVPDVTWKDIGALQLIREELTISVLEPIRHPEKFEQLGLTIPAGVMLYGPPGCGKTLLAKAIANESGANFISVKGPELLDKYVGESERAVRLVFERARASSPCVVFFDELDSLVPRRGGDSGGSGVSERVVNQLLTEMDGLESRRSVFIMAATNRPELIDPAMMRPGRLDKLLYVPLPTPEDRSSILRTLAKNTRIDPSVNLDQIARSVRAEGYSGADCAALLREAGLAVLKEDAARIEKELKEDAARLENSNATMVDAVDNDSEVARPPPPPLCITERHFYLAFKNVMPSVSRRDQARYDRIRDRMARARCRNVVEEEDEDVVVASAPIVAPKVATPTNGNNEGGEQGN